MDISKTSAPEASSAIDMHKTPTECGPTAEGNPGAHTNQPSFSGGIRPVNQLLYLAKLLKFEVYKYFLRTVGSCDGDAIPVARIWHRNPTAFSFSFSHHQ